MGSIITAIDGVQNKEFHNAFCAVRPPGHHAEKNKAMGFCIYNNVAVGAHYLLKNINSIKLQLLTLMFITEMEHKIFFMIMKKFYIFQLINTHITLEQEQRKKKVNIIIFLIFLYLLVLPQKNI